MQEYEDIKAGADSAKKRPLQEKERIPKEGKEHLKSQKKAIAAKLNANNKECQKCGGKHKTAEHYGK